VRFVDYLIQTVKEEQKLGNKEANEILFHYKEVINDGIDQIKDADIFANFLEDDEYLMQLKIAKRKLE
jgi:hypothetical protein